MATAAGYDGGAGGKFRKRPFRRTQTTPYDRPPTVLRPAHMAAQKNGWLSKLVDPASKLITAGAQKLFSSLFRKRLLPLPQPPDVNDNTEIMGVQPEATTVVVCSGGKEPTVCGENDASKISDTTGVAELEDILKHKTFTRSEIDHLTALLLSRTADSDGSEKCTNLRSHATGVEHVAPEAISTPSRKKVLEEDVASPAELAKAYMGSRPSKVSPLVFGLHNKISKEDCSGPYNPPLKSTSPGTSLHHKPVNDVGIPEYVFSTPRYRGRSAIYNMARTPYSRIHPTVALKAAETAPDGRAGSSSSHNVAEHDQFNGSNKQVLKRRSSVLENDIGSVGPIRRIRQKSNLLHPKILSLPASGGPGAHGSGALSDAAELPSSSNWSSHNRSLSKSMADTSIPSTSSYVPSQSVETAQKIFQELDKFTPKGKSPELKIDVGGGKSACNTSQSAYRCVEALDSSRVLQSSQDGRKENGPLNSVGGSRSSLVEVGSLKRSEVSTNNPTFQNSADATSLSASHSTKVIDHVTLPSGFGHPPKMRAFQMSAHEDYLELDDDVHVNGVASTQVSEGGEPIDLSKKSAAIPTIHPQHEAIAADMPAVPEQKPPENSLLTKKESNSILDGSATSAKATGFTFPAVPSSSPAFSLGLQAPIVSQSTSLFDKAAAQNELTNAVPAFNSISDKLPAVTSSTISSILDSSIQKNTKSELLNSANNTAVQENGLSEDDKRCTQEPVELVKKPEDSLSSTKSTFSFGLPANNAVIDHGLPIPTASRASLPVLFSSSSNQSSAPGAFSISSPFSSSGGSGLNGFTVSTSTSATATATATAGAMESVAIASSMTNISASSSQQSSSVTAPSIPCGPIFQFGTSTVPSSSSAMGSSASQFSDSSKAKLTEPAFGNATNCSQASSISPVVGAGANGTSGFNALTPKTAYGGTQGAAPAASNGSIFGFQASPLAVASTSAPSSGQFPSSTSASVFGLSGATNFGSGGSVFAANPPGSGVTSSSSLGVSSTISPVSSSSGTESSIFGSSWQPSKPTISAFGATSPSTGFSFGALASGPSADSNKAPVLFGSTPSSSAVGNNTFSFGAASSSAAPVFSFSSTISTPVSSTALPSSQPAFGAPTFAFGSATPSGNNDQMSMEDSMAEDSVQASTPAAPVFGQPQSGLMFGATTQTPPSFGGAATATPSTSPFQFGSQQNPMGSQNPSPFQPSGSVEFNAGGAGSFSLGTGGDKSGRKFVKVKNRLRKK